MKLIKNIQIYAPDNLGVKDVLISDSKIEKIDDRIELSYPIETIDGTGCILTPGLIDRHVHITGGGGEAGFISRAKPIDVQEILDAEPMIKNPEQGITETNNEGTLEFENVTFVYPDGEEPVIKNVSFSAKKGETIAFIGSTGSGKSTLINLIPRFYDVTAGSIRIDGIDVRKFNLKALRKKIGFIRQKNLLFTGTIKSNIKFGKPHATHDEVEHSARIAQAYDFITNKEKGFDEPISEGGSNVSGGQKQRLSIARALVRKPEIYIFDDSFSALDFKTDAILRKALKKETTDAIVLIVAQRIGSIMDADKIIVLDEGKVVGVGKHKELLKTCNVYHEIALSQLTEEELA